MAVREFFTGAGLGTGLMYFFDPNLGRRRRHVARDKFLRAAHHTNSTLEVIGRDLSHRVQGWVAEIRSSFRQEPPDQLPDGRLLARVRSALGRHVSHPGAIFTVAHQGKVTLSGPVLADEVDHLLSAVRRVRGVQEVENRLDVHQTPEGVPSLQGPAARVNSARSNWSPAQRFVASAAGAVLMARCARKPSTLDVTLGTLGFGLFVRAVTNMELFREIGFTRQPRAIDFQKTISIDVPVEKVYSMWTQYENFPRFMRNVREVKNLGSGRSHWRVAGPLGAEVSWNATVTQQVPNRIFAWRSEPGSPVANAGVIHFSENEQGSARVHVQMTYAPPAGVAGHLLASLFGADPKREMDEDLLRMKSFLETGKTPHDAAAPQHAS